MATYTTYKNLEKPDVTELYHINVANKNNDILDSELHKIELSIGNQNELFAAKQDLNNEISRAVAKENSITDSLDTHTGNDVIHVTQTDKNNWNDADIKKHIHDNKNILDGITSDKITEWDLSAGHISDSVKHVTEEEREKLNNSYEHSGLPHAPLDAEKNIIVGIQKNGVDLPVSDGRKVNIEIPTGIFAFEIREDGHLWMVADSEIQGQNFHINNDGCLIYTLEG